MQIVAIGNAAIKETNTGFSDLVNSLKYWQKKYKCTRMNCFKMLNNLKKLVWDLNTHQYGIVPKNRLNGHTLKGMKRLSELDIAYYRGKIPSSYEERCNPIHYV